VTTPALHLDDVSMAFHNESLLRNISLEIKKGESFVLIGPSGFGKTVVLKLLAGLLAPTRGHVRVEGHDINTITHKEKVDLLLKMGMLFQKNALFDSLTCGENVAFPQREVTDRSEMEIQERVVFFLEQVGLSHARELFPDEISGGMQKRLGIARALALDPEIVLYDDPTAGLDPITSRRIVELILNLRKERKSTVVAITNDMARAFQLADRIGMVVNGELIICGNKEQTLKHKDPRVAQFVRGSLEGPLTSETNAEAL
jgi:phospholipid/cholesterol/gamma-HCH transport system ATP-binding protein